MTGRHLRICLVASEILGAYKNGGIGTATTHLALLLARRGYAIHIVYTGVAPIDYKNAWIKRCEVAGIKFTNLETRHHEIYPIWLRESCVVFNYLRTTEHDVILFQDWEGLAFSSVIAKKNRSSPQLVNFGDRSARADRLVAGGQSNSRPRGSDPCSVAHGTSRLRDG